MDPRRAKHGGSRRDGEYRRRRPYAVHEGWALQTACVVIFRRPRCSAGRSRPPPRTPPQQAARLPILRAAKQRRRNPRIARRPFAATMIRQLSLNIHTFNVACLCRVFSSHNYLRLARSLRWVSRDEPFALVLIIQQTPSIWGLLVLHISREPHYLGWYGLLLPPITHPEGHVVPLQWITPPTHHYTSPYHLAAVVKFVVIVHHHWQVSSP